MIYLKLQGRIGNQIFMYATARMIQKLKNDNDTIYIEDTWNESPEGYHYDNSLMHYPLENVQYVHDLDMWESARMSKLRRNWAFINRVIERDKDIDSMYSVGRHFQWLYNSLGIFHMENGYVAYPKHFKRDVYVHGYFQSEKFFEPIQDEIRKTFFLESELEKANYPDLEKIKERNTVCISIKVQHNAGNYMYDVCNEQYYEKAINYIIENVENPLFFICSDDVNYVKEHLIDTSKYEVVTQAAEMPVHLSLSAMACSKHFIIGNTSFGWWAQYLSTNPDKIVIVPDRWYNGLGQWQYDIYQDNMVRIEV